MIIGCLHETCELSANVVFTCSNNVFKSEELQYLEISLCVHTVMIMDGHVLANSDGYNMLLCFNPEITIGQTNWIAVYH